MKKLFLLQIDVEDEGTFGENTDFYDYKKELNPARKKEEQFKDLENRKKPLYASVNLSFLILLSFTNV